MAGDEAPGPDEYFMLWVLIAQTKDAILRARERDYARYGISNETTRRPLHHPEQRRACHACRDSPRVSSANSIPSPRC